MWASRWVAVKSVRASGWGGVRVPGKVWISGWVVVGRVWMWAIEWVSVHGNMWTNGWVGGWWLSHVGQWVGMDKWM